MIKLRSWTAYLISRLHWLEDGLLIVSLALMVALAFLQIILRNIFETGIGWADPFLRMLVLWVTLLGAMIATREKHHISIDLVRRYLKNSFHPYVDVLTSGFSALICWLVAWYALELVLIEYEDGIIAFGSVPVWFAQSIIPVGFCIMAIRFSIGVIESLLKVFHK